MFRFGKVYYAVWYDIVLESMRFERCECYKFTISSPDKASVVQKYYRFLRQNAWDGERILYHLSALELLPAGVSHWELMEFVDSVKAQAGQKNFAGVVYWANKIQAKFSLAATATSYLNLAAIHWMERAEVGSDFLPITQRRKVEYWLKSPIHKQVFLLKAMQVLGYTPKVIAEVSTYLTNESEEATRLEGILNG